MGKSIFGIVGGVAGGAAGFALGGPVGAAVGASAGGAIGTGIDSSNAAEDAAQLQAAAAERASELQYQEYQQQRQDQAPWRQAGQGALSQMGDPSFQHNFSSADFEADPGYAFRMQEGQKALERSAAARGGLQSGGTLKAITQYGQDYASNEYQNAYNRFTNNQTNRFNRLASIAGLGQTANGMVGEAGQNYVNNVGQNTMGAANAAGAAQIASANAMGGTLSSLGNTWMGYQQMSNMNNWMNRMYPGTSGGGAPGYGGFNFNGENTGGYQMPAFGSGLAPKAGPTLGE